MFNPPLRTILFTFVLFLILRCHTNSPPLPEMIVLPEAYVYTIVRHNDSLYYSTPTGQIYRSSINTPTQRDQLGLKRFMPIRSLVFTSDGTLYAASYQTGVQLVEKDTLIPSRSLLRRAWSMKKDSSDMLWLAGPKGVFRQVNDTIMRFSTLRNANDIAFFRNRIAVAHRRGVTLFDMTSETEDTTYCRETICWLTDSYDSLLVCGGVERCEIIEGDSVRTVKLPLRNDIPWHSARATDGTIYLACQKGLMRILPNSTVAKCIAYRDSCIKSVYVDENNTLWIGRYFESAASPAK